MDTIPIRMGSALAHVPSFRSGPILETSDTENRKKETDKRRGSIALREFIGDKPVSVLSHEQPAKHVWQGLVQPGSTLTRVGYNPHTDERTEPIDAVVVQETACSLGLSTQSFKNQHMINRVALDMSSCAIKRYKEAQEFHAGSGSIIETYV